MAFDHPFYFLRHGETTWNASKLTQGQFDSTLSEKGVAQAVAAGESLKDEPIARIVSSPLRRAFETAEAVAVHHGLEVESVPDLMECHLGVHQGEPHGPWLNRYWEGEYDPPGGETYRQFRDRVWAGMAAAVARGPNTLIVAHGGLWKAAHDHVAIDPPFLPMPNATPLHVTPDGSSWAVRLLGS